jgi:hypothetical protein
VIFYLKVILLKIESIFQSYPCHISPMFKSKSICIYLDFRYLGLVNVHLIRELYDIGNPDDVPSIVEVFFQEAIDTLKAKLISLGGNCMLGFRIECLRVSSERVGHLFALISVCGDAVLLDRPERISGVSKFFDSNGTKINHSDEEYEEEEEEKDNEVDKAFS